MALCISQVSYHSTLDLNLTLKTKQKHSIMFIIKGTANIGESHTVTYQTQTDRNSINKDQRNVFMVDLSFP